jgi:hypothetical protein
LWADEPGQEYMLWKNVETKPGPGYSRGWACHGVHAGGVEGLGISLVDSEFAGSATPEDLTEFLKVGRRPNDPASITGRPMPVFNSIAE